MVKLVAMYKTPDDVEAFERHYAEIHTPIVKRWPGLRRFEASRITGAPIGETKYHFMAEMYFDDEQAMQKALASPDGKAAARDVMEFAGRIVTMFYAEVVGEG